jgi:hypothetical protein
MSKSTVSNLTTHALELAPSWLLRSLRKVNEVRTWLGKATERTQIQEGETDWQIPAVDDWYELTRRYSEFRRVSNTALKDFGYMKIFAFLDADENRCNILEFGHGFSPVLFKRYCDRRNVWGLDRCGAAYFTQKNDEWEATFRNAMGEDVLAQTTFKRGLLGDSYDCGLSENYFDILCSVSVLEELPIEKLPNVAKHAAVLLKPGGVFIGTHDIQAHQTRRVAYLWRVLRRAGLIVSPPPVSILFNEKTLVENPTAAMLWYQHGQGETRTYAGHWSTVWIVARKPLRMLRPDLHEDRHNPV